MTNIIVSYDITKYISYFELSILHDFFSFIKVMIIIFLNSNASLSSIFLSTIDFFNVFSYNKVIKIVHSHDLVYLVLNFEVYSFVIKIAILVSRALLDDVTIPILGLIIDSVEDVIAEPDRNNISVIIYNTFFLFKLLYFFL